jgi:hypothetical protein
MHILSRPFASCVRLNAALAATSLFALLSIAVVAPLQAGPLRFGVRAGANLASVRGDFADLAEPKIQPGLSAGGLATLSLAPMVDFEIDVLYVQKGFKTVSEGADDNGNPTGTSVESHLRLQYLDVPMMAKLSLPSWGLVSPYVVAGPNMAFALAGKIEAYGETSNVTSDLTKVVLGATGGLGFKLGTGPISFGIESRYTTDFADLWDLSGNVETINHGVSVTAWAAH